MDILTLQAMCPRIRVESIDIMILTIITIVIVAMTVSYDGVSRSGSTAPRSLTSSSWFSFCHPPLRSVCTYIKEEELLGRKQEFIYPFLPIILAHSFDEKDFVISSQ